MSRKRMSPPAAMALILAMAPLAYVACLAFGVALYGAFRGALWTVAVLVEVAR